MIGQEKLLSRIDKLTGIGFARFTILCGPAGSGKHLVCKYMAQKLNAQYIECGISVDEIREVISLAYKQTSPTLYTIANADKMSPAAKNALLKITEEPPQQAYFVMTLLDMSNTLETLKSRAYVLHLDAYAPAEIKEYAQSKTTSIGSKELDIIRNVCTTPGMVDTLLSYDIPEFYAYVNTVADNVGLVSGVNAFKITSQFKYKDGDSGWDLLLFMRVLLLVYSERMRYSRQQSGVWHECCLVVSKYAAQLKTVGINKSSTVDMMILELRGVWQRWN